MSIEAMKQALETLYLFATDESPEGYEAISAITALRTAIEQAEKQVEPLSIEAMKQALEALEYCKHLAEGQRVWGGTEWSYPFPWKRIFDSTTKSLHTIRAAIEQAEKQEPVAWMRKNEDCTDCITWFRTEDNTIPLYTAPPKREWVGLTKEKISKTAEAMLAYQIESYETSGVYDFAIAIEAELKEKNT